MKCEVFWRDAKGKYIHEERGVEATHLTIGSAMDVSEKEHVPMIFAVCEAHADIGTRSGWVTISPHVAKHIGWMAQALREAP